MTSSVLGEDHLRRLIDAGRVLVAETDPDRILRHLLDAARELTGARYAAIGVLDESHEELERFITAGIDDETRARIGDLPRGHGVLGALIRDPKALRLDEVSSHPQSFGFPDEHPPMHTFLGLPVVIRGDVFGNLYLTEKEGGASFTEVDEEAAGVLAEWAAIAIDRARAAAQERLRESIAGTERERRRWSRELHDETLQGMGAIRVVLATGLRMGAGRALEQSVSDGIAQLGEEIDRLRGLITDLRPAALDELGLGAAIEELARRAERRDRNRVTTAIILAYELGIEETRLDPELESALYRIIQESLRNAGRHAKARTVSVNVIERDEVIVVTIEDDGKGFDTSVRPAGFGLRGLRERVQLVGGTLEIESGPGSGTTVTATPAGRSDRAGLMPMPQSAESSEVVIAFDDSASGHDALALGRIFAEILGAKPLAVTVIEMPARIVPDADLPAFLDSNAGPLLRSATDELGPGAGARALAGRSVRSALHGLLDAERPLLAVVGSTNRGRIGRVLPGTTAAALLHGAPCAIAVAPRGFADEQGRHVLRLGVAVDPGEESALALRSAILLAERLHGSLRALTVKEPLKVPYFATYPGLSLSDYDESVSRECEETLARAAEQVPEGIAFEGEVLQGNAAEELVRASDDLDMLVMGSRSYGPPKGALLGSVSQRVITEASCTVLVIPRDAGRNLLGVPEGSGP